jgi:hypothetical protein
MPEPEVTSNKDGGPHRVEAGTSMADAGTGSDVTSKMAAPIGNPPQVVASAPGDEVTRSGLRRAYLFLACRPAGRQTCLDILRC